MRLGHRHRDMRSLQWYSSQTQIVLEKETCATEETRQDRQCGYGSHENYSDNCGRIAGGFERIHGASSLSLPQEVGRDIEDDRCQCVC